MGEGGGRGLIYIVNAPYSCSTQFFHPSTILEMCDSYERRL